MAVVAGLFDSDADATRAMNRLLNENIKDLETHVINGSNKSQVDDRGVLIPFIAVTSGGGAETGAGPALAVGSVFGNWLGGIDQAERQFYEDAVREGSTLALASVPDDSASRVRSIFQTFGARVYEKE
jgi:hypothetical protein